MINFAVTPINYNHQVFGFPNMKYPIGIQSFSKLREEGYVYVDKTAYIWHLIEQGGYFFLSRPRRFGKSLLLSTIESYFQGRRDLFTGLALDSLATDWSPHPILHLDLNNRAYSAPSSLNAELNAHLEKWEALYGDEKKDRAVEERFAWIIEKAYEKTGKKVVILVDEYDKPLLSAVDNPTLADHYRDTLKAFFSNLKSKDAYIRFAMLTGVARFSKVSVFSDLNNLNDISFSTQYAAICGVTDEELEQNFLSGLHSLGKSMGFSTEEARKLVKENYDGYHFAPKCPDIYNPFSLMSALSKGWIDSYWFETGTPSFLIKKLRRSSVPLYDISPVKISSGELATGGIFSDNPVPLLYQSGYLTIKSFLPELRAYLLDYPNREVKEGFLESFLKSIVNTSTGTGFDIIAFVDDLNSGKPEDFMRRFNSLLSAIGYPTHSSKESNYQTACFVIFSLLGYFTQMESMTSDGRSDIIIQTSEYLYVIELKVDIPSSEAMDQILEKQYWLPFTPTGKKIFLVGASFSSSTGRLSDWLIREVGE